MHMHGIFESSIDFWKRTYVIICPYDVYKLHITVNLDTRLRSPMLIL